MTKRAYNLGCELSQKSINFPDFNAEIGSTAICANAERKLPKASIREVDQIGLDCPSIDLEHLLDFSKCILLWPSRTPSLIMYFSS